MYKTRIPTWGLRKNFTLAELKAVATTSSHFVEAGLNIPLALIDNREVPVERVKRHFSAVLLPPNSRSSDVKTGPTKHTAQSHSRSGRSRRETKSRLRDQPKSRAVPRIRLQHSAESHQLESTMIAVNNYCTWRLAQGLEYFTADGNSVGGHIMETSIIDATDFCEEIACCLDAAREGAYHTVRLSIRQIQNQAHLVLRQQGRSLLENLLYTRTNRHQQDADRLRSSIYSYLAAVASELLGHGHPITILLRLIQCHDSRTKSSRLLLRLMCDIARREPTVDLDAISELEFDLANASVEMDDFATASESCQTLLKRFVDIYGERHWSFRRLLYLWGYLNYKHDLDDEAEETLLRVIHLDDNYAHDPRNTDGVSADAMEALGYVFEAKGKLSEAEEWYCQAHVSSCHNWGYGHPRTQLFLHQLTQFRRKLGKGKVMYELTEVTLEEVMEEIQMQLAQVDLEGHAAEFDSIRVCAEPWNEWERNIKHSGSSKGIITAKTSGNNSTPTSGTTSTEDGCMSREDISSDHGASPSHKEAGTAFPVHQSATAPGGVQVEEESFHEDQTWQENVPDGLAAATLALAKDPLACQLNQDTEDVDQHDFGQFDMDDTGIFDWALDQFLTDVGVPNDAELVDDAWMQPESSIEGTLTSFTAGRDSALLGAEAHSAFVPKMDSFGFGDFHDTEMFGGTFDLLSPVERHSALIPVINPSELVDFDDTKMFAGIADLPIIGVDTPRVDGTIDPKLIFGKSSGRRCFF